jgi:DNA modification methylase
VGGGFGQSDKRAYSHPATFPEALARDHILTWSNPGDVVLDPMVGSGTTCIMSKLLGRQFIGVDISREYCDLAVERVNSADPVAYEQRCRLQREKQLELARRRREVLEKLSPIERELLKFPRNL